MQNNSETQKQEGIKFSKNAIGSFLIFLIFPIIFVLKFYIPAFPSIICIILLLLSPICSIALAIVSFQQMKNSNGRLKGKILAVSGIVLSSLWLISWNITGMLSARKQANTCVCENNLKSLGTALEKYIEEENSYPVNLIDLVKKNYIEEIPRCPTTKQDYIYKIYISSDTKFFEILCPNPENHRKVTEGCRNFSTIKYKQDKGIVSICINNVDGS